MKALNKVIPAVVVLNPMAYCDFNTESIGASYTIEVGWVSKRDGGLVWISSGWAHGVARIFVAGFLVGGLTVLLGYLLWVFWWVVLAGLTFVAGFFRVLRIFVVACCIGHVFISMLLVSWF